MSAQYQKKQLQNDWLIENNSFPIGEFIFIFNTDWQRNNWIMKGGKMNERRKNDNLTRKTCSE